MDTFTRQDIRCEMQRQAHQDRRFTWLTEHDPGDRQGMAEDYFRSLAHGLAEEQDPQTKGWPQYVSDKLWEDCDYDGMIRAAAERSTDSADYDDAVTDAIIQHVLDCNVMDERDWLAAARDADLSEQADRAYDRRAD